MFIKLNRFFHLNSYVAHLPLLGFYLLLIWHRPRNYMDGDEPRYYDFATNLIHGFYSTPAPNINLWAGPGFPIVLIPFVALHLPIIWIKIMNAAFMYFSVVYLYKTLKLAVNAQLAFFLSIFWGLYYFTFKEITMVLTEPLTSFLVSALLYCVVKYWSNRKIYLIVASGLLLGYLALTKIIWGYVILVLLITGLFLLVYNFRNHKYKIIAAISTIAFLVNIPYLIYTYNLTGKILYWGNSGGMSLYWMSTPFPDEYGDWKSESLITINLPEPMGRTKGDSILQVHHKKEMQTVLKYNPVEQDDQFKKIAIKNITAHPLKFFENCISNISRMFLDAPYSYTYYSKDLPYNVLLGGMVLILCLYCTIPTIINWSRLDFPLKFVLFTLFIYLFLSTLVSAYPRQLYVVLPIILFWIGPILEKSIKIKMTFIKRDQRNSSDYYGL